MISVRIAADDLGFNTDALSRGVACFVLHWLPVQFNQHRIVHVRAESILNGDKIGPVTVRRDLDTKAQSGSKIINKFNSAFCIALADELRRDKFGIRVDGDPCPYISASELTPLFLGKVLFLRSTEAPDFIKL